MRIVRVTSFPSGRSSFSNGSNTPPVTRARIVLLTLFSSIRLDEVWGAITSLVRRDLQAQPLDGAKVLTVSGHQRQALFYRSCCD